MSYIDRTDISKVIGEPQLQQLEKYVPTLIGDIAPLGESYITNHVSDLYDLSIEFAKVGDAREPQVKMIAVAVVAYYAFQQVASDQIPDIRVKAYDDAVMMLEKAAKGKIYFKNLTRTTPDEGRSIRFGGETNPTFKTDY